MIKADLHCHSEYSDYPSTWMHKLYNSPESFTTVETLYQQATDRGMAVVTITDHDDIRGCLELVEKYPENTFISCEVTTYFPEDNCKVHVLVYGITEAQYEHMMKIRRNLYRLREYIIEEKIAYSLAHASYDQDGKLSFEHIEKLVVLFDVFEIINGGSSEFGNTAIEQYLKSLTPNKMNELSTKLGIKAINRSSWKKGYTGGSDDHCGLLLGTAYTMASANNVEEFLGCLRDKQTLATGMHGSFQSYAFGVFKHLHDYQLANSDKYSDTKSYMVFEQLFNGSRGNWRERLRNSRSLKYLKHKSSETHAALFLLLKDISESCDEDFADKVDSLYSNAARLHDSLFIELIKGVTNNLGSGNLFSLFTNLSRVFPAGAMLIPFLGSLKHQSVKQDIKNGLMGALDEKPVKRCLWFTDTIDDLNGVSVSLRQVAQWANNLDYQMHLVTCVKSESLHNALPENTINFESIAERELPFYDELVLRFPSFLDALSRIAQSNPDKIIISTPGPLGLIGMIAAKLLDVPVEGVYHTDFGYQAEQILGDASLGGTINQVANKFYQQFDKVYVPSLEYIDILDRAGLQRENMSVLPRGIDTAVYAPSTTEQQIVDFPSLEKLPEGFTLIFAGRVSADKNIDLVCDVFTQLRDQGEEVNLIIAGSGPDLPKIEQRFAANERVLCTGRVSAEQMPALYNFADLQVFPSRTDTFGMVILEGQACGLPALVTNSGGPKEIIIPNETGEVVLTDLVEDWQEAVREYMKLSKADYAVLRNSCSSHVLSHYHWENLLTKMLGSDYCAVTEEQFDSMYLQSA